MFHRIRSALAFCTAIAMLVALPASSQDADPFYLGLLRDGVRAHEEGDHLTAVEELRIACFGLLEAPEALARGLTHLALAHAALEDATGFASAFARLIELEERFSAFTGADLDSALIEQLEIEASRSLADSELVASGLFASAEPLAPALEPAGDVSTPVTRLCISWNRDDECRATTAPSISRDAMSGPTDADLALFDRLAGLRQEELGRKKLRRAYEEAQQLADTHPEWAAAQRLAATLAYRSSLFPEAVDYFRRGGELADDEPWMLYCLSVSLYETDAPDEAATVMRRALPALEATADMKEYVDRILGPEAQG